MRYLLVAVGCLECADGDDCGAEVTIRTDDLDIAKAGMKDHYSTEFDTFIIDTATGDIVARTRTPE